jgi:glycine cleavage system H protein
MTIPDDLRYSDEHLWVRAIAPDTVRLGITDYAQDQLGDVLFVRLPKVGERLAVGGDFGEVESTKSVSDLIAPVAGEVLAVNAALADRPELINSEPYDDGWMVEIRVEGSLEETLAGLRDASSYQALIES